MVILTKLNTQNFALNSDLIETIEETPDTVITMTNGNKYVVKETTQEVINKIINYKRQISLPVES
ncbi:flagellar FlbD family protein [Cellulosilyticum ruminicola]|uniref:flagellar FlbD family protein n=1 Tax=Cellulosilyticum ruminicola TaxID=425254 RepID=UPI0006D28F4A|nr:flagellar FlbD family protein [Cellulosilyticum ruminicola]